MKQDEFMESIYGCLERIENKINGLSMPQSADGSSETDNSVNGVALQEITQELNTLKTGFRRVLEALVMIKGDTANLLKRNSMPDKFMETLSVLKGEQQEAGRVSGTIYQYGGGNPATDIGEDGVAFRFRQEQDGQSRYCQSQT